MMTPLRPIDLLPKPVRVRELFRLFDAHDLDGVCLLPVRGRRRYWARLARKRRRSFRGGTL